MGLVIGRRVRWKDDGRVGLKGDGVVVAQPLGTVGSPPPGGCYVLWDALREPMAVFEEYLEASAETPKRKAARVPGRRR